MNKINSAFQYKNRGKIKIAHLIYGLKYGGAEKLLIPFTTQLNKEKFETIVIALYLGGPVLEKLRKESVKVYLIREDAKFGIFDFFKLISILKKEKVDIIHTHLFLADFWGGLASRLCRGSLHITTTHGFFLSDDRIYNFKQRLRVILPKYIIAVSKKDADTCINRLGVAEEKIRVIYNGIEIKEPPPRPNQKLKKDLCIDNDKVILNVGSLEEIKGHIYLLKAAEELLKARKDIVFLIIGDGSLRDELQKFIDERKLNNYVKLLGLKDNVDDYLSICDIFLSTSLSEGLSLSILEAMALGKCVIATNVGGNPEIIDNNINGILVPPKDPLKIAQALNTLLENDPLRKELGENARSKVKKYFNQETMIKRLEDFYIEKLTGIRKTKNITLIDVYSPANIGSYSLLENSLKILISSFKNSEIRIFAYEPISIQNFTGIKSFKEPFALPFKAPFFKKTIWCLGNLLWVLLCAVGITFHIPSIFYAFPKNKRRFLKVIKDSDIIVSVGAERINDNIYKAILFYLFQYWLIRKMRKKMIFFPQTIGPLYFNFSKFLIKKCLNNQTLIMVRDEFSRNNLFKLGIEKNVEFVPDVSLLQENIPHQEAQRILSKELPIEIVKSEFLGVSVLKWKYFKMRKDNFSKYKEQLADFFDWVIDNFGINIVSFSTNFLNFKGTQNDVAVGLEIKTLMRNKKHFFVLEKFYNPKELKGIISLSEIFVSTRMHVTIFSTSSFIPTISINYQPKCREYMKLLGLEDFSIDIDDLDTDILKQILSNLWEEKYRIRETLKTKIPQLQEKVLRIPEIIKVYLNDK